MKFPFDSFLFETFPEQPCLPKAAKCDVPVPASLRRLVYDPAFKDGNLAFYLQWHADTLQVSIVKPQRERGTFLSGFTPFEPNHLGKTTPPILLGSFREHVTHPTGNSLQSFVTMEICNVRPGKIS